MKYKINTAFVKNFYEKICSILKRGKRTLQRGKQNYSFTLNTANI